MGTTWIITIANPAQLIALNATMLIYAKNVLQDPIYSQMDLAHHVNLHAKLVLVRILNQIADLVWMTINIMIGMVLANMLANARVLAKHVH